MISSIGKNVDECLESLIENRTGLDHIKYFNSIHQGVIPVCDVKYSNEELFDLTDCDKKGNYTRTSLLGMIAAKEAIADAQLTAEEIRNSSLISATTVGGMDKTEDFFNEFLVDNYKPKLRNIVGHDCADSTEAIADFIGNKGMITTVSTACSSSINSIMLGTRLIQHGFAERVIVGGTDSLTRFTVNGFNSLMILDKQACKPFDKNRNGLNIGEGAAFLVLESEDIIKRSGKKHYGYVSGFANACDAFHQTASSPDGQGAFLAMQQALLSAQLEPNQIDYINVHGTGTSNNDLTEGIAMKRIFGETLPPFSSTKPFTGHTLGATGAIEAVISLLSMHHGIIIPNLNFSEPIEETQLIPVTQIQKNQNLKHVLSNSFGFGGNNSSIIFSKA